MKFYKLMFLVTLIMGTLIAISSYSWMSMWIGLEINLLSIIPLLNSPESIYPSESALKYFITQALASTLFLFSVITTFNINDYAYMSMSAPLLMILNSSILTKMGAAPFHAWFPEVMEGLDWLNSTIMLTWQKIAPMVILLYNMEMTFFLSSIIVFSSVIGGLLGINQVSLRKILAYSSINHIGWMVGSMLNSQNIWMNYFIIYSIITINIVVMLSNLNCFNLKQLFNVINNNKLLKFFFMLNFLSLGGLPPFLGFFPKWLTINSLISGGFFTLSLVLIISTLITLFFYLRMTFSTMMVNSNEIIPREMKINKFIIILSNFMALAGLIACTLVYSTL
uniref:NADH-ubiquinone oxidoreductase chain 2 n=1 Tax=Xixuthrus sp. ANIC_25-067096 TaxID=2546577 RepID=A0A6H0N289_9CUCU|nr:NADH dehydrogenase subunit 2 [Xixuthrus sp. ANIC_25-067096]